MIFFCFVERQVLKCFFFLCVCVCRFERDVWAAGDRTVRAGESVQLPHSGGQGRESVHYP